MNIIQLESLSEDERDMMFYIVNRISPIDAPKMEFDMNSIKWFKHDMLIKKMLDSINSVNPEYHAIYVSLLEKMGVKIEIKKAEVPLPPTASVEPTGSL